MEGAIKDVAVWYYHDSHIAKYDHTANRWWGNFCGWHTVSTYDWLGNLRGYLNVVLTTPKMWDGELQLTGVRYLTYCVFE